MISYPFQHDLFKNVLTASSAIQGRFFMCPLMGREISYDELGGVIQDLFAGGQLTKKYPLVLEMPPVCYGKYTDKNGEWETYSGILFFLNTTYYSGTNQVMAPNAATGTSTHMIMYDWHDMKRCAVSFLHVLNTVIRNNGLMRDSFRLDQERERIITPVTQVGVDKASGVRLDLRWSQFIGCTTEDYEQSAIDSITIPVDDSHPEHQL